MEAQRSPSKSAVGWPVITLPESVENSAQGAVGRGPHARRRAADMYPGGVRGSVSARKDFFEIQAAPRPRKMLPAGGAAVLGLGLASLPRATGTVTQYLSTEGTAAAPAMGVRVSAAGMGLIQYCVGYLQPCANFVVERGNFTDYSPIPVAGSLCDIGFAGPNTTASACIRTQVAGLMSTDGAELQRMTIIFLGVCIVGFMVFGIYKDTKNVLGDGWYALRQPRRSDSEMLRIWQQDTP